MATGITPEKFELLLPLACQWAAAQEQRICSHGQALSDAQLADARLVGVAEPERVRLLYVPEIAFPEHPALRAAADASQLISPLTGGLTLRYGIFIRSDCRFQRTTVVHELGHTAQYERLGGFESFFRPDLFQCLLICYPEGSMEQGVISLSTPLSGSPG